MSKYKANIEASFILEEQEMGDDSWNEKFGRLLSDENFKQNMAKFVKWDLDCKEVKNVSVVSVDASFSELDDGVININSVIDFELDKDIDDWDSSESDDTLSEVKNGLAINYAAPDEEFNFLCVLEDTQVSIETI